MPTVPEFTPGMLWTTIYGLLALCLLFMIGYKVYDAIHTINDRRREKREASKPDFAEAVSQKVIEKLEPRFQEIENNLNKDKKRLESHEALITGMESGQKEIHDGLTAICSFMLTVSMYGNLGDNDQVKSAAAELQKFLAKRL